MEPTLSPIIAREEPPARFVDAAAPAPPDRLAAAVVAAFGRRTGMRTAHSFARTLTVATLSFGIVPLIVWPLGLRDLIRVERWQFEHLAEWYRLRSGSVNADRLSIAARRIRPRFVLSVLPRLIAVAIALVFIATFARSGWSAHDLLAGTYEFGRAYSTHLGPRGVNRLFAVWFIGLTLGYSLHLIAMVRHRWQVGQAVQIFSELTASEGLPPLRPPMPMKFRPIWIVCALPMSAASALWAVPLMIAGGLQRRYAEVVGPQLRVAIADRVSELAELRRPPIVPTPKVSRRAQRCERPLCQEKASSLARFCARCGMPLPMATDSLL